MSAALYFADLVAVALLVFAMYLPRQGRREMALAYLAVNTGVLAVAAVLAQATTGAMTATSAAGLGFGLFGVLSIIRLRSEELSHREIAYYFGSLAIGMLAGLGDPTSLMPYGFMALLLAVFALADLPQFARRSTQEQVVLDRAIADRTALRSRLEHVLGARPEHIQVVKLDLVNDLTIVDVRYRQMARPTAAAVETPSDRVEQMEMTR